MRVRLAFAAVVPEQAVRATVWRWTLRVTFVLALAVWAVAVALVLTGNASLGILLGVPAGFILLAFAWRRVGFWLPDGGGGPPTC